MVSSGRIETHGKVVNFVIPVQSIHSFSLGTKSLTIHQETRKL